jgi:antitoxin component YwqK of YwqJK toxin-antitoxin module
MNKIKLEYICEYYENGQLRYEEYYLNDKRHNPNGPAYRRWYENGQLWYEGYYLNGKELTKEQFEDKMNKPSCADRIVVIDGVEYKLTPLEK